MYNCVYVPICKRALSIYSAKKKSHGAIDDIYEIIFEEFGIKVPSAVIRKLLRGVDRQMSHKEKHNAGFTLFENGQHFSIGKYAFAELEIKYRRGQREANAVQDAFEKYLEEELIPFADVPPFSDFLQKNNSRLAAFFNGNTDIEGNVVNKSYYYHVEFLRYIESSNHQLYSVIESLYLGSIVVSFLEADFDFEAKFSEAESYYLDTPFLLRVMDLQKEEDCKAAHELIELIKKTKGDLRVLSITVDELQGILEKAINLYDARNPTSTINEACQRRGINKTYLISLAGNLENFLAKEFGLKIEPVLTEQKEKFVKTNDLKLLREKRIRAGTAEHDVMAYLYVRAKRGGVVQSYQKARTWFLTTNTGLLSFNREMMPYKGISEIVLPDALTSLLWLRNPVQLAGRVKKAGLSELMAVTISEEIVSKELISDFEVTISSLKTLTKEDYNTLLNSVAYESAKNLEKFIDKSNTEPELAAIEAQKMIEKERHRRKNEQKRLKEATLAVRREQDDKSELSAKIAKIESDLVEFSYANQSLRAIKDSDRTIIENLQLQIQSHKRFTKRWIASLVIFMVFCIVGTVLWYNWENTGNTMSFLWKGALGSGAVWSFGSFVINARKALKEK